MFDADYLNNFCVMGENDLNCDFMSQLLYEAILKKFKIQIEKKEYFYFSQYQERAFNLVEDLREKDTDFIEKIINFLGKNNPYLADVVIMQWCLPRPNNYLSKRFYKNAYRENIKEYNYKLTKIVENQTIKNFCIETLTKNNNVPVHCIDLLWFYMGSISFELTFFNSECSEYISFTMSKHDDDYIDFGLDAEYILDMGLGQILYENDPNSKGSFSNFIKIFFTDRNLIKKLLTTPTKYNYFRQLKNINQNLDKYFRQNISPITEEEMASLELLLD